MVGTKKKSVWGRGQHICAANGSLVHEDNSTRITRHSGEYDAEDAQREVEMNRWRGVDWSEKKRNLFAVNCPAGQPNVQFSSSTMITRHSGEYDVQKV